MKKTRSEAEVRAQRYWRRQQEKICASNGFPLGQWFDLTREISREDCDTAADQMALYALKEGLDPDCPEVRAEIGKLRAAVREHNAAWRSRHGAH